MGRHGAVVLGITALSLAATFGVLWYASVRTTDRGAVLETHAHAALGIAFEHPDRYAVAVREGEGRVTFTVAETSALRESPEAGEGPPTITIELFKSALGSRGLDAWLKATPESNFALSPDRALTDAFIAGERALAYGWDGLYRGNNIAFARGEDVYILSVTYLEEADGIRDDFAQLAASFRFE